MQMNLCNFKDSWNTKCKNHKNGGQICGKHKFVFDDIRKRKRAGICIYSRWYDFGNFRCDNKTINGLGLCCKCYERIGSEINGRNMTKRSHKVKIIQIQMIFQLNKDLSQPMFHWHQTCQVF